MRRGKFDAAADVLREAIQHHRRAPTRIMGSTGVPYAFLKSLTEAGLAEITRVKRKRRMLRLTDRGREFLKAYKTCERLFPRLSCDVHSYISMGQEGKRGIEKDS